MFTPVETCIGAFCLHWATTVLLNNNGAVLGASGLLREFFNERPLHSALFLAGMGTSMVSVNLLLPDLFPSYPHFELGWRSGLVVVAAGLLTGWGTKGCNGCTSGHMLSGLSRLSGRSAIATALFFPAAFATFHLTRDAMWSGQLAAADICPPHLPCYVPTVPSPTSSFILGTLSTFTLLNCSLLPRIVAQHVSIAAARLWTYPCAGLTFGLGLLLSGMASPAKVASFFNISLRPLGFARWDPSLGLVLLFAVLPNALYLRLRGGFAKPPKFATAFAVPAKTMSDIDGRFVAGAIAFGAAWGATGVCPGPAVLRAFAQPSWGVLWMAAFWVGGSVFR